jgi:hypothetical protein
MWPSTPRLHPIQSPSIHESDMPGFTLHSSSSGEPDATSLCEGDDEGVLDSKNEVQIDQKESPFKPQYFRVDELWDDKVHAYKLTETLAATGEAEHHGYIFNVRRSFDFVGEYVETVVDIKSKVLRNILQTVISSCKAICLQEETPKIDPDTFFLYLEDIKKHYKKIKVKSTSDRKKTYEAAADGAIHLKCLIRYVEEDYKQVKEVVYPLIEAGNIIFPLL